MNPLFKCRRTSLLSICVFSHNVNYKEKKRWRVHHRKLVQEASKAQQGRDTLKKEVEALGVLTIDWHLGYSKKFKCAFGEGRNPFVPDDDV